MQEALHTQSVDDLLESLEQVLSEERAALVKVDAEGIERAAQRKSELSDALGRRSSELTSAHRTRLASIHQNVRHNIVLLVHAREYVQTTLSLVTGQVPTLRPFAKPVTEAVRLDLRG
jgi:flagellar biosynthesis/type III secretory pathway chaperone